ncbi:hypothetical protein WNY37_00225 [Henriciella sp. AS95]|uniref:hypothetical protein n=1 Tax=Henriciella sp. AS95 TaxID=3135782 RepID=UPI00316E49D6
MVQQIGFNGARKRYHRVFWPAMILYVIVLFTGIWYLKTNEPAPWVTALVAVGMALPACLIIWAQLRWIVETDEYTRLRNLKAYAVSTAITISGLFVIGFLQRFDMVQQFDVFWIGPFFLATYGGVTCAPRVFGKTV